MPRIGVRPEDLSKGGGFNFPEGRGLIVNAVITNHSIPGYSTSCGYRLSIQKLDNNGKPTADEPIDEFLAVGSVEVFHPGKADSKDDKDPQLEINGSKDLGTGDDVEGNCVLTVDRGPSDNAKMAIFMKAAVAQGVKSDLFDGWAANLIGMDAHFTQKMLQKPKNSKSERDPTCLIIGRGGNEVPAEKLVYKYPDGTGVATLAGSAGSAGGRPTPATARSTPPPPAESAQHVNGAPTPTTAQAEAVSAPVAAGAADEPDDIIARRALDLINADVSKDGKGLTITRKKLGGRVLSKLATMGVRAVRHQAITDMVKKDDQFFQGYLDDCVGDWAMVGAGDTASVTITAAPTA